MAWSLQQNEKYKEMAVLIQWKYGFPENSEAHDLQ